MKTFDLRDIEASLIDETVKGMPGGLAPTALSAIGRQGWNVLNEDLPLPLAVLSESALRHNSDWMRKYLTATGAEIAPHGKTTMSPQLYARQIEDGAWAITIGSVEQLQVARRYGFQRLVLANQMVGARAQRYVIDELKRDSAFDFYCFVEFTRSGAAACGSGARQRADAALASDRRGRLCRRPHRLPDS